MNMKVQTLAILLLAAACGGAYATTGVTTSGAEITVCVEAGETLTMPPIDASVTKVVKTGGGEAQFTPAGVTNMFTAALEIQAGTLSGHRASFGKSSLITVVPGATLKLTGWDASAQWTQDTTSTIGAGKARIGGSGVAGAGARHDDALLQDDVRRIWIYASDIRACRRGVLLLGRTRHLLRAGVAGTAEEILPWTGPAKSDLQLVRLGAGVVGDLRLPPAVAGTALRLRGGVLDAHVPSDRRADEKYRNSVTALL